MRQHSNDIPSLLSITRINLPQLTLPASAIKLWHVENRRMGPRQELKIILLFLALSPIKSCKAVAKSRAIVTYPAPTAVATRLVSVPIEGVRARRTLHKLASRSAIAHITQAPHRLARVPGSGVEVAGLLRKDALGKAKATTVAVLGTHRSLARTAVVPQEAIALARLAVAGALVRAFHERMQIVGVHDRTHPGVVLGARA